MPPKSKKSKARASKPVKRARRSVDKPSSAIIPAAAPVAPSWKLGEEEITILKNSIAKGATDAELTYMLKVAERRKLDPFKQQIWFVRRWDRNADNGKGGTGANVWVAQVGIDGLLFTAARDHKAEYGSVSLPEFGAMIDGHPEWAMVSVFKKGEREPTVAQAYWDEYVPNDLTKAPFWRKMPRRMIAKCATALAIRQAYPDLGGMYIPEEMERMHQEFSQDVTESGRQIMNKDGFAPSGKPVTWEARQKHANQLPNPEEDAAITNLKAKNLWCEEHHCTRSSKHAQTCETTRKALEAILAPPKQAESQKSPIDVKPSPAPAAQHAAPTGLIITVDWTADKASPRVTGDIQDLACANKLTWAQDQFYHCLPFDVEDVRAACLAGGIEFKEIMAELAPPPPKTKKAKTSSPSEEKGETKSTGGGVAGEHSAVPTTIRGIVGAYKEKTTKKGNPFLSVLISSNDVIVNGKKEVLLTSFNLDVNNFIKAAKGKIGTFIVEHLAEQWPGLIGLKELAGTTYTDGKIPDIQRSSQPAGGKTLFG